MKLDIVIPAYNEEAIIAESVRTIQAVLEHLPHEVHIIVADNGSTDSTARLALEAGAHPLTVAARGKGAALIAAARHSTAPLFAFIDADLSAHPKELEGLLTHLELQHADVVIGSRLLASSGVNRSFMRTFSSQLFNSIRRLLLGIGVEDTQCGLKLMNERGRAVLATCEETGWFLDLEFLARAERAGLIIREVPIAWEEFYFPGRGSKLRVVRDGIGAVAAMLRIRQRLY